MCVWSRQEDRTLDIMCQTEEEFNLWYNALKFVWDQIRSRSQRPRELRPGSSRNISPGSRGTPVGGGQSHGFANQNLGVPATRNVPGDCYIWGCAPERTNTHLSGDLVKVTSPHLVPSSQKLDIIQVSCGSTHFAAVTRSGHLYSWGSGPNGVLGLGSTQFASIPTSIPDMCSVQSVSCGETISAAITDDGSLMTWGSGLTGQLGQGQQFTTQHFPKKLPPFLLNIKIRQVSCGPYHSGAVCEAGGVYTWGDGFGGKLGHGQLDSLNYPKRVDNIDHAKGISCGYWHTAVVAQYPQNEASVNFYAVYTWGGQSSWGGDHNKGCLGNDAKSGEWEPYRVEGALQFKSIKQVSCGLNLTVALTEDGEVYQMGTTGAEDTHVAWDGTSTPVRVEGPLKKVKIEQIACGRQHVIAVAGASSHDRRNQLYSWGVGKRGQLGLGTHRDHTTPQLVEDLNSRKILNVCCGGDFTLVVCSHDHRVAAANINQMTEVILSFNATDNSPTSNFVPRRNTRTLHPSGSGQIVNANQLRLPLRRTVLATRDPYSSNGGGGGGGSMEQIFITTGSSVRKMKSDTFSNNGGGNHCVLKLDRSRTGSTPLSDAPSSMHDTKETPRGVQNHSHGAGNGGITQDGMEFRAFQNCPSDMARSPTPTSNPEEVNGKGASPNVDVFNMSLSHPPSSSQDSNKNLFEPVSRPILDGVDSVAASDPGEQVGTSSEDESVANTDGGALTHDAYSDEEDEEENSSQGPRSEKSIGSMDQGISKQQVPESFRAPIMPFPPSSADNHGVSGHSSGNLAQTVPRSQQTSAGTARLRSRQRGLERRLGVLDTWTCEQVIISKHTSAPVHDLTDALYPEKAQTAREDYFSKGTAMNGSSGRKESAFGGHRRSASAQNLFLSTLKEDSDASKIDQKAKLGNYMKLIQSLEKDLLSVGASQKNELVQLKHRIDALPKLLEGTRTATSPHISSFFEVETVEKTINILNKITDSFENVHSSYQLNNDHFDDEDSANGDTSHEELQILLQGLKKTFGEVQNLVLELRSLFRLDNDNDNDEGEKLEKQKQQQPTSFSSSYLSSSLSAEKKDFISGQFTSEKNAVLDHHIRKEGSGNASSTTSKDEASGSSSGQMMHLWMEKVDPGVSIVFQSTGNCTTKIKKIRFAKRMFAWDEAHKWWEKNQQRLIKQYGLEPGYDPMQEKHGEH